MLTEQACCRFAGLLPVSSRWDLLWACTVQYVTVSIFTGLEQTHAAAPPVCVRP